MSTLRRRIKTEDIRFRFEDGKYFILDEQVETHHRAHRPSLTSDAPVGAQVSMDSDRSEPVINAANKLLNELKKAYTQILQEKEEQILQFREEISDLKTLVRVLESENDRIKKATGSR